MFKIFKNCTFVCLLIMTGLCYIGYRYGYRWERGEEPEEFGTIQELVDGWRQESLAEENNESLDMAQGDVSQNEDVSENAETGERTFCRVEMDYLEDALFIGDSRTATLYEYAKWEETDFFVKYGMTVWGIWESEMDGKKLEDILLEKQYGKIYIMLGINELGRGTPDSFCEQFQSIVDKIRSLQPEAIIFIQSIMHVTQDKDDENTYINNDEINNRNEKIRNLADEHQIFYLNINEAVDNADTGKLEPEYSFDGVHLKAKYINLWQEYLLNHGIVK